MHDQNKSCPKHKGLSEECKGFIGKSVLLITSGEQLQILGQVFRPIFCGKVTRVTEDTVTLFPVQIRMHNAPEFVFPTPLIFNHDRIVVVAPFDCDVRFPLT